MFTKRKNLMVTRVLSITNVSISTYGMDGRDELYMFPD